MSFLRKERKKGRKKRSIRRGRVCCRFVGKVNGSVKYVLLLEYVLDSINMAAAMLQIATVIKTFNNLQLLDLCSIHCLTLGLTSKFHSLRKTKFFSIWAIFFLNVGQPFDCPQFRKNSPTSLHLDVINIALVVCKLGKVLWFGSKIGSS